MAGTAGPIHGLSPSGRPRPSRLVLAVRVLIIVVAAAALASPLYVALHGRSYLNQPPPPFWGVNVGTTSAGSGATQTASLGGC